MPSLVAIGPVVSEEMVDRQTVASYACLRLSVTLLRRPRREPSILHFWGGISSSMFLGGNSSYRSSRQENLLCATKSPIFSHQLLFRPFKVTIVPLSKDFWTYVWHLINCQPRRDGGKHPRGWPLFAILSIVHYFYFCFVKYFSSLTSNLLFFRC